jgi:hypothetical protein
MRQDCDGSRTMTPTLDQLIQAASLVLDIEEKELRGKGSHKYAATYRQCVMWLAVRRCGLSASSVARFFDRDHTTVIYGVRCVQKRIHTHSIETIGIVEDVWEAAQKVARGEGVRRKVKDIEIVPLKANPPPPKPEPLKHWKHYEVCSENWWRANHAEFVKGMMKARAGVFQEAGE